MNYSSSYERDHGRGQESGVSPSDSTSEFWALNRRAEYPHDSPVAGEHIARTVFHAMGIDDLHAADREGRPFHLMEDGRALTELF
ncbi:MAG: hypothetical protein HYR84_13270 [Planctomycetes bacterium]|nr:hypothetical protein [Planctomycetota bacterium]